MDADSRTVETHLTPPQNSAGLDAAAPRTRRVSADAVFGAIGVALLLMWGTLAVALWDAEKNSLGEENVAPPGAWVLYLIVWLGLPVVGIVLAANEGSPRRRGIGLGLTFIWWGTALFFAVAFVWLQYAGIADSVPIGQLCPEKGTCLP